MSRRTKGAGTVFRKGNKWVAQIDLGVSPDGKRMRRTRIASTRREAEKLLRTLLNDRDLGLAKTNENPTLKEIWAEWYEIGSHSVKPSTRDQYIWRLEKWVSKRLAATKVRDITPQMLMAEIRRLSDAGYSSSTVQGVRRVLSKMLNHAVVTGRILVNPMTAVRAPRSTPSKKPSSVNLSVEQAKRLQAVALKHADVTASTVILLGLRFGLRHGEILGLRLSDIDLKTGFLTVNQAVNQSYRRAGEGAWVSATVIGTPKTRASHRWLQIGQHDIDIIERAIEHRDVLREQAGIEWVEHDLLLPSAVGTPINQSNSLKRAKKIFADAGVPPITIHRLRHSFATLALEHNSNVEEVQQALGHTSIRTTKDIYASSVPKIAARATATIDRLLAPDDRPLRLLPASTPRSA
jgi:integrase